MTGAGAGVGAGATTEAAADATATTEAAADATATTEAAPGTASTPTQPSSPAPRVLVIVNDVDSPPGKFADWLAEAGIDADVRVAPEVGVPEPTELDRVDGLILLAGGLMPDETDRAPWLRGEADLVRRALDHDLPQLGVCLGGQLIAHVAGGTVQAQSGTPEKGYTWIDLTEAAAEDPVFSAVSARPAFLESHVDRIVDLPAEAVLLATSPACRIQAFRIGRAWGTQFHPEATAQNISRWDEEKLAKLGFNKDTLEREAEEREGDSLVEAKRLFTAFLTVVRDQRG
ncbi:type 1 glutamine amidotransferase [Brevibacterium sp. NPDC056726]|uniref:type 1 glutamine amidotransferase n=2 Tax=unclassified Brevibacterium TaxID=2614124 RepID=UPI003673163D